MLDQTEAVLERGRDIKNAAELSKLYHAQLVSIMDQVERIAYDNGGSLGGGGGVSLLEAEVLNLRRQLASSKLEIAMMAGEREEQEHIARQLNKQLAEVARSHHSQ